MATPGRLNELLSKKKTELTRCAFLALDEARRRYNRDTTEMQPRDSRETAEVQGDTGRSLHASACGQADQMLDRG